MINLEIQRLLNVMKKLRDPHKGCSWDKKQTMESIKPHTIEEVYEVAEEVYNKNYDNLKRWYLNIAERKAVIKGYDLMNIGAKIPKP